MNELTPMQEERVEILEMSLPSLGNHSVELKINRYNDSRFKLTIAHYHEYFDNASDYKKKIMRIINFYTRVIEEVDQLEKRVLTLNTDSTNHNNEPNEPYSQDIEGTAD